MAQDGTARAAGLERALDRVVVDRERLAGIGQDVGERCGRAVEVLGAQPEDLERARVPRDRAQLGVGDDDALLEPLDNRARELLGGAQRLAGAVLGAGLDDQAAVAERVVAPASAFALAEGSGK